MYPLWQAMSQRPARQTAEPCAEPVQGVHEFPQLVAASFDAHVPLQSCVPSGQLHLAAAQMRGAEHDTSQSPQCAAAELRSVSQPSSGLLLQLA
jgi:hypothetical protein